MIKDGGPAFPQPAEIIGRGMTLRDYFAAKVLPQVAQTYAECEPKHAADVAEICYQYADAMIALRNRELHR